MFERTDHTCSKLKLLNNRCKHQVVNQLVLARRGCFPKVSMLLRQYCLQITAEQLLWEVRYSTVYFFFSLFIYCGHIINRPKNAKRPHFGHQNRESKTLRNFTTFYSNWIHWIILLQAVYRIPTESVALALQRVFYHLQTSDQPVGEHPRYVSISLDWG